MPILEFEPVTCDVCGVQTNQTLMGCTVCDECGPVVLDLWAKFVRNVRTPMGKWQKQAAVATVCALVKWQRDVIEHISSNVDRPDFVDMYRLKQTIDINDNVRVLSMTPVGGLTNGDVLCVELHVQCEYLVFLLHGISNLVKRKSVISSGWRYNSVKDQYIVMVDLDRKRLSMSVGKDILNDKAALEQLLENALNPAR